MNKVLKNMNKSRYQMLVSMFPIINDYFERFTPPTACVFEIILDSVSIRKYTYMNDLGKLLSVS